MPLPPDRDHRISLEDAAALTRDFRGRAPWAAQGGFFHAKQVRELLSQPGVAGLRYYYAREQGGAPTVVLVAVDQNGNDMTEIVLEFSIPCPPVCPEGSPLAG